VFSVRRPETWTLADVLDFEALVAADERAPDPAAIATHDARLWQEQIAPQLLPDESADRPTIFHRWLKARRANETLPGTWLTTGWRMLAGGAVIAGLALGFLVASGALYYAGARPVNVAVFLAVTVGVQWLLLERLFVRAGESIGQWLASALEHLSGPKRLRLRAEAATLRQLAGRNLQLLRWPPWLALQGFGIAWNLGVLAALLARVVFTDVAFGWESTSAQGPDGMHALARAFAAPWTWFAPNACPTLQQVEHSWFHYQSGVAALDRAATASWWPWLVGFILVYGLLPRAALWFYFWTQSRLGLRKLTFDEPRHRAAWYRLTGPVVHTNQPPNADSLSHETRASPNAVPKAEAGCLLTASSLSGGRAEIERWVTVRLGWRVACSEVVEIDYPSGNDAALGRLAAAWQQAPCWLIAVPAPFTAFSAFTQFVARLKTSARSEGFVLVVALDEHGKLKAPDAEWTRYWSDFLRAEASGCATLSFTP
jgi:hypothetical protein